MSTTNALLANGVAMGSNVSSTALSVSQMTHVALHSVWTGTPTGTLKAQYSCDGTDDATAVTNWVDIPSMTSALAGAAGSALWDIQTGTKWVRVTYVFTSGSGTLTVRANGKGAN